MGKAKKKRSKPKMTVTRGLGLFMLLLPAGVAIKDKGFSQGTALRLRRDYGGIDENGKFRGEFLLATYGAAAAPAVIKKVLKMFGFSLPRGA